jgi:hypothetical protein
MRSSRCGQAGAALILASLVCATGCARVASPSGGPEDRTLPRVIGSAPDSGSVGALGDTISILFSKKMDHRSVRDWLFISPPLPVGGTAWDGDRYLIRLGGAADSGRTYTILVGSEVVDRRKNPLGPWTSAFSTGGPLDDGKIEGRVRSGQLKAAGAYLYVWPWSDSLALRGGDTSPPLRMGQCGKDGKFSLSFLPRRIPLRVCALYDSHHDRSFDAEDDTWGCLDQPVILDDTTRVRADVEIYMVLPDEPGTISGSAIDSSCVGHGIRQLRDLAREGDSLAVLIGAGARADSAAVDTLIGFGGGRRALVDTLSIRTRLKEIESLHAVARDDSARCSTPVIVRLLENDTTLVAEERGEGGFEFRDVEPGIYRIRAFRDLDANGVPGSGEASGEYPFAVELAPGRTLKDLKFPVHPLP